MTTLRNLVLAASLACLDATPAFAGDGGYVLTQVQHDARSGAGLTSLNSLRSSDALFANSRSGDQSAGPAGQSGKVILWVRDWTQDPSTADAGAPGGGTGKTISSALLGKADGGGQPAGQAGFTDGSVRFISSGVSQSPSDVSPTGTFFVDNAVQRLPKTPTYSIVIDPRATGLAPKGATFTAPTGTQAYNEGGVTGFTRKVIGPTK